MVNTSSKCTIIVALVIAALLVIILGLAIGLGLQAKNQPSKLVHSCHNRCLKQSTKADGACECDSQCVKSETCCSDYQDICVLPKTTWECTNIRCGEQRLPVSNCHCSDDCQKNGDCCTNYLPACQAKSSWVDEECEIIEAAECPNGFDQQPLILISLDGFRAEYMKTWYSLIPHLNKLRKCGTSTNYMKASYPTKTFPNHYTIATGLYPEAHGIVDNSMYDVVFDAHFSLSSPERNEPRWWGGQPIWLTAEFQGVKAGTYFWPGSDVPINNTHPSKWKIYNGSIPFEERVITILQWLDLQKEERPGFYTLYFEQPDHAGHGYGPVSGQVIEALQLVDQMIGQLMDGLKQRNLHKCVNVIVVADHGMDAVSCSRVERLASYMDVSNMYVYQGSAPRIRAYNVPADYTTFPSVSVVHNLSCVRPDQHFKPYLKWNQPKRLHNAANRRIDDAVLLLDRQWLVSKNFSASKYCTGGSHGYDNEFKSMNALFISYGPKFNDKTEVQPFQNIELYNLMCDVLEIDSAPNNGTHGSLNHLLRKPSYIPKFPEELLHPESCQLTTYSSRNCSCSTPNDPPMEQLNKKLNLSDNEVTVSERTHLPLGRPINMQPAGKWCLLMQQSFISAFRMDRKAPMWVSYTISKHNSGKALSPLETNCTRDDPRLQNGSSCSISSPYGFLYPPNLNNTTDYDGLITSNMMPMYPAFKILWEYIHNVLLMKYAEGTAAMNVISGPVYDDNYDGVYDTAEEIQKMFEPNITLKVPSHFFLLIATCVHLDNKMKWCEPPFNVTAFVLPHQSTNLESCADVKPPSEWAEERLWTHVARPRDVELLTGLRFYSDAKNITGFDLSKFLWTMTSIKIPPTETAQ
uniref:ectonucleotide pyrophosphatase/phosphodiesterase family member 3-like isoform X2 n=1 Tax=Myxine glutinosa TaxID=7769 RepID=UPI00358F7477